MDVKELKRELSRVSGIDFFSPKYRAVFKKFTEDDKAPETDEAENTKAVDAVTDTAVVTKADEVIEDIAENRADDRDGETPDYTETDKDETELTEVIKDNKEADDGVQEVKAETDDTSESAAEETRLEEIVGESSGAAEEVTETAEETAESEPEVNTEEEAAQPAAEIGDELLTVKLELELVRAGIREDRLETAKRLFMPEFKSSGGNVQQIRELISQYPEWIGKQGGAQGFGMPLGDKADALTNEEKALKRMGIDPRN